MNKKEIDRYLDFCPHTGEIRRKIGKPGSPKGAIAGRVLPKTGYRMIGVDNKVYSAHRLMWLHVYGDWPKGQIDHINGDRLDNRPANLRDVSATENQRNKCLAKNNKSGIPGVVWVKAKGKWQAQIWNDCKSIYLGQHGNIFDAACARKSAENMYGYHPNHGRAA